MNAQLHAEGYELENRISVDFSKGGKLRVICPILSVIPLGGRKRKGGPSVIASYCPFCGKSLYPDSGLSVSTGKTKPKGKKK